MSSQKSCFFSFGGGGGQNYGLHPRGLEVAKELSYSVNLRPLKLPYNNFTHSHTHDLPRTPYLIEIEQ